MADASGRTVTFGYDGGNLVQQTNADGSSISYAYDGSGRLQAADRPPSAMAAIRNLPEWRRSRSPMAAAGRYAPAGGRQVKVTDAAGNITTYGSTVAGQTQTIADAAGNVTTYAYDATGHKTSTTTPTAASSASITTAAGNLTASPTRAESLDRQLQRLQLFAAYRCEPEHLAADYDAAGRLSQFSRPLWRRASSLTRNAAGLVTAQRRTATGTRTAFSTMLTACSRDGWTAPGGNWSYQYDGAQRSRARAEPAGPLCRRFTIRRIA